MFYIESKSPADSLYNILTTIHSSQDPEVIVRLSAKSPLFYNPISLKIIKKAADSFGKKLSFEGLDKRASLLLRGVEGQRSEVGVSHQETRSALASPSWLRLISGRLSSLMGKIFSSVKSRWVLTFVAVLALGGAVIGGAIFYVNGLTWAKVNLTVSSNELAESFKIYGVSGEETVEDEDNKTKLPLMIITVEGEKKHSIPATGEKLVGSKASGTIRVYNKTDNEKKFPKNTVATLITTGEAIRFLMSHDITVPPRTIATASADKVVYQSGSVDVSVVAEEIGSEGNVEQDNSFTVGNESTDDFVGENSADFGGGESRKVTVVTQEDLDNALSSAKALLREEIINDVRAKMVGDQRLEQGAVKTEVVSAVFDKELGEEATEVGVTLTLNMVAGVYSEERLREILTSLLEEKVPDNYSLTDDPISFSVEEVSGSPEETLLFNIKVRGYVVPRFDKQEMSRKLAGMSLEGAAAYLQSLSGVVSSEVQIGSRFSFLDRLLFSRQLPQDPDRIEVSITSE